jgi:predicted amino acid racemase
MNAPRLEIDLEKISANAAILVKRLGDRGMAITGVTKVMMGCPVLARTLLKAGVSGLGDSRIENIERMRAILGAGPVMTLIRSPMLSQAERVVQSADISFNTELAVIEQLSVAALAAGRTHGVLLMIELGDLREGIMPSDLDGLVRKVLRLPNIALKGIGTNLACLSGTSPDATNMAELSALAHAVEGIFGSTLDIVSGGNSANIEWAFGAQDTDGINDLRLGEAILFGREALHRKAIDGLHGDAFALAAEVIEAKRKPTQPRGVIAQNAFGEMGHATNRGEITQAILAIGRQDCDPAGLDPPTGMTILGASSDHLVIDTGDHSLAAGDELRFGINYTTLLRAMTSPFVNKVMLTGSSPHLAKFNVMPDPSAMPAQAV